MDTQRRSAMKKKRYIEIISVIKSEMDALKRANPVRNIVGKSSTAFLQEVIFIVLNS